MSDYWRPGDLEYDPYFDEELQAELAYDEMAAQAEPTEYWAEVEKEEREEESRLAEIVDREREKLENEQWDAWERWLNHDAHAEYVVWATGDNPTGIKTYKSLGEVER